MYIYKHQSANTAHASRLVLTSPIQPEITCVVKWDTDHAHATGGDGILAVQFWDDSYVALEGQADADGVPLYRTSTPRNVTGGHDSATHVAWITLIRAYMVDVLLIDKVLASGWH